MPIEHKPPQRIRRNGAKVAVAGGGAGPVASAPKARLLEAVPQLFELGLPSGATETDDERRQVRMNDISRSSILESLEELSDRSAQRFALTKLAAEPEGSQRK